MDTTRTVWVLADAAGRKLWRGAVSRRRAELWALGAGAVFLGLAWTSVHAAGLHAAARQTTVLVRQNAELRRQASELEAEAPTLDALVGANQGLLRQLERRSGFTFVSLVSPASGDAAAARRAASAPASALQLASEVHTRGLRLEAWLGDLLEYWHDAERRLANTPSVRPARTAWLSSSYGVRTDPITHVTVMHKGLDLAGYIGMLVYAPADGKVIWTGVRGGYGQVVVLDHGWGLQTHFAHLSKYLVQRGDQVRRGEPIAEMGNTGRSTGPHLHYEVRQDGFPTDPRNFILD